jgi:hypothetical protein
MAPEVAEKQALEEELRGADAQQLYNAAQEPRDRVRVEEPRRPRVGDVVLYTSRGSADGAFKPMPRAAIVTDVREFAPHLVDLCVLNPTGIFFDQAVEYAPASEPGRWSYRD